MERITKKDAYWIDEEFWISAEEPDDEEIDKVYMKLKEYEDLEEQGRLIVLPCKMGDTVYIIGSKYRRGYFEDYINTGRFDITDLPKLGNSVFLTKEEAEKALAEMGE